MTQNAVSEAGGYQTEPGRAAEGREHRLADTESQAVGDGERTVRARRQAQQEYGQGVQAPGVQFHDDSRSAVTGCLSRTFGQADTTITGRRSAIESEVAAACARRTPPVPSAPGSTRQRSLPATSAVHVCGHEDGGRWICGDVGACRTSRDAGSPLRPRAQREPGEWFLVDGQMNDCGQYRQDDPGPPHQVVGAGAVV